MSTEGDDSGKASAAAAATAVDPVTGEDAGLADKNWKSFRSFQSTDCPLLR